MRLVFMGTPEFALPVLESLLSASYQVVAAYTRPDRPLGRGRRMTAPPVKAFALAHDIPVRQPASLRRDSVVEELRSLEPEAMVVAAYGRILPPAVLAIPPKGVLNIHPSLLPRHRGPSPVATALLEGESCTGVTVMLMDEGMDTGPVLAQRQVQISPRETAEVLTTRLFRLGAELLLEVLPAWKEGTIAPVPQDEVNATTTRLYTKEDGALDWSLPAWQLERRLRAFHPWPGCYTHWEGRLLKVLDGVPLEHAAELQAPPGQVVALAAAGGPPAAVATGDGLLGLLRVQLEGRRAQDMEEFLRGHPGFLGARLPS